ncbi:hypothetical protein [Nocardioides psychrotolerans]|uniref:hypothetical protein n=1 Tax=Nocardioides psychrotolerans TaxID=1005945 RepID=UPI003137FA58
MTTAAVVHGTIETPGPCVALLTWSDATGRVLGRRRSRDLTFRLTLAPGRYRIDIEDDRPLADPRRHGSTHVMVDLRAGDDVEQPLRLEEVAVLRGVVEANEMPERHARVHVRHEDGRRWDLRTDAHGRFLAAGLPSGALSLRAYDARRTVCAVPVAVAADRPETLVRIDTPTATVAVRLTLPDGVAVPAAGGSLVDTGSGLRHPITVHDGVGAVTGVAPGSYDLVLEPSLGVLGGTFALGPVASDEMVVTEVVVERSAVITGRVLDAATGLGLLAAPVSLFDADGTEVERTRTDRRGSFVLGRDLRTASELTVVVSGGPERRHVQRLAVADVEVRTGRRVDLGSILLPQSCTAHWSPRLHVTAMTLPATRV